MTCSVGMKGRGVPFPPKRAKAPLGRHGREKRGLSPITDTAVKNVVCPLLRLTPLTPEVGRGFTATDGGALKLRPTTAPYNCALQLRPTASAGRGSRGSGTADAP